MVDLTCEVSRAHDMGNYLQELVSELATFRFVLNAQDVADARSNPSPLETVIRKALSDSLDAMEAACTYGLGVLADEKTYIIASRSTAAALAQPSRMLPPSSEALLSDLDDLDALMDNEIVLGKVMSSTSTTTTTTTSTATKVPPKQQ